MKELKEVSIADGNNLWVNHLTCNYCGGNKIKQLPKDTKFTEWYFEWFFCTDCGYRIFVNPSEEKRYA